MSETLSSIYSFFYGDKQSQLGYLFLDVLVSEQLNLPSDVTKYPIEDGTGDISDHITQNNEELTINGLISSATSFGVEFNLLGNLCHSKMTDAIDQLRKMHKERKEIKITTGIGKYEDMAFTALTVQRSAGDKGGQWLDINATLRKIKKVKLKKSDLPADGAKDDAKGKTGSTEKKSGKSGSSSEAPSGPYQTPLDKAIQSGKGVASSAGKSIGGFFGIGGR